MEHSCPLLSHSPQLSQSNTYEKNVFMCAWKPSLLLINLECDLEDRIHCSQKSHNGSVWWQTKIKVSIRPQVILSPVFHVHFIFAPSSSIEQKQPQSLPQDPRYVPTEEAATQRQQFSQFSLQWLHRLGFSDFPIIHTLKAKIKGKSWKQQLKIESYKRKQWAK